MKSTSIVSADGESRREATILGAGGGLVVDSFPFREAGLLKRRPDKLFRSLLKLVGVKVTPWGGGVPAAPLILYLSHRLSFLSSRPPDFLFSSFLRHSDHSVGAETIKFLFQFCV